MADFDPENSPTDKLFSFWLAYEKEAAEDLAMAKSATYFFKVWQPITLPGKEEGNGQNP